MPSSEALASMRNYYMNRIANARIKVGESCFPTEIHEASVLSDGRISISFIIDHTIAGDITVTEVQLLDADGVVWESNAVSITRKAATEGILYRFFIRIDEQ